MVRQHSRRVCAQCGGRFLPRDRLNGVNDPVFCSVDCLAGFVFRPKGISSDEFIHYLGQKNILKKNGGHEVNLFGNGVCYSHRLGSCFRSFFEAIVAETFVCVYKEEIYYEPFEISLHLNGKARVYIPDFFLPKHGIFLEVKGAWLHGSKKKFLTAVSLIGSDRLILVPPYLRNGFVEKLK